MDYLVYVALVAPPLWALYRSRRTEAKAKVKLQQAVDSNKTAAYALYPKVDMSLCGACEACTKVCPEGDILRMIDGLPTLVTPTKCVGHGVCERSCPFDAITLVFGTDTNGKRVPNYNEFYETNVPGLYIAGELGGMGLIGNAIRQGTLAADHAIKNLNKSVVADVDVLVVGAGPAGLAASLKCLETKTKYRCIEQNSFGGTVFNFPRQKVVMSHPASLPITGKMQFPKNRVAKEGLLEYWEGVKRKTGLKVEEKINFINLKSNGKILEAETSDGIVKAQKIILAVGVGGSPRKLGLPNEDTAKVTYKLIDPEQYKGKKVVVVGAGDSAVEAAQRVADPKLMNTVHLLVRKDSLSRCKEDNKIKVEQMEKDGLLEIWYTSGVKEIHQDRLRIKRGEEEVDLPNDYLILFMGTIPPFGFLEELGVEIRTLYGEPLS